MYANIKFMLLTLFFCCSVLVGAEHDAAVFDFEGTAVRLELRPGSYTTDLQDAVVIAPADMASFELGQDLGEKLGIPVVRAADAVLGYCQGLKPEYLDKHLILLGNINNNEAIIPLYAKFLSWADAAYPGNGGYAVRTIRNPHGSFLNNLLIAASDYNGLKKGVEAFLGAPELKLAEKECDYIFLVQPNFSDNTANELRKLKASVPGFINKGGMDVNGRTIGQIAVAYYLTGDPVFREALIFFAEKRAEDLAPLLPSGHYHWENFHRAFEILTNSNLLAAETVRRLEINLFIGLHKYRNDYGIRRHSAAPGGRHQLATTSAYMMLCESLQRNFAKDTSSSIKEFVETNFAATAAYFQNLFKRTYSGSDDSSSTASNMTSIMQAALFLGDTTIFENSLAMEGAKKMIATVDNWGYGAGVGTYEDAYEAGMTKKPYGNGGPLCYTAFYYRDAELKWVKENMNGMRFSSWFARTWFGLHKYATGNYLKEEYPENKYLTTFCRPRPLTLNNFKEAPDFRKDDLFDKAVIRTGHSPDDAYICFQGNGSAKEGSWGSASDTLVLLRYADLGVLWLANNTQLDGFAWRNSFMVSDGAAASKAAYPYARLNSLRKSDDYEIFSASVSDVRGGMWTRQAVYMGSGKLFIADSFVAGREGEYSFLQTFKTPVPARKQGNMVVAAKSGFRMTAMGTAKSTLSIDHGMRRMEPQRFWYFRRSYDRKLAKHEKVTIATLFDIRVIGEATNTVMIEESSDRFHLFLNDKWTTISLADGEVRLEQSPLPAPAAVTLQEEKTAEATSTTSFGLRQEAEIINDYAMTPEAVRGWQVVAPELARAHVIDDNIVKRWDPGCGYDGESPLIIDLMDKVECGGLEICTTTFRHVGQPRESEDIVVRLEFAATNDFRETEEISVVLQHNPDMRELYKMDAWQVQRYTGMFSPRKTRFLRVSGLPARIAELGLYSGRQEAAGIKEATVANLNGDGEQALLIQTLDRRITAFDRQGQQLFSIQAPFDIIDLVIADFDGNNNADIIFACADLRLYKHDWQGRQVKISEPLFQRPYTLNVLTDNNTGAKKLAITYYYHHQFFDGNLKPLFEPKKFGSMWVENAQAIDIDGNGVEDLVMSDIYARAHTVNGSNGDVSRLFWSVHGIFNGIFPVGKSADGKHKVIFAGTGKLRCRDVAITAEQDREVIWDFEDGSQFSAAATENGMLHTARFGGHLLTFDAESGNSQDALWAKGRIFAVKVIAGKRYIATDQGLKVFDRENRLVAFVPGICQRIVPTEAGIWLEMDGKMLLYSHAGSAHEEDAGISRK